MATKVSKPIKSIQQNYPFVCLFLFVYFPLSVPAVVGCWITSIPFAFSPGDWIPAFHHHLLQPTLCCPPFRYLPLLPTHLSSQAIYRLFWGLLLSWQTSLFESSSCSSRNQPLKRLLLFLKCNQVFSQRDSFKICVQRVDRNSVPKEIDQELPFLWNWFSFYDSPRAESATGLRAVKSSKMVSLVDLLQIPGALNQIPVRCLSSVFHRQHCPSRLLCFAQWNFHFGRETVAVCCKYALISPPPPHWPLNPPLPLVLGKSNAMMLSTFHAVMMVKSFSLWQLTPESHISHTASTWPLASQGGSPWGPLKTVPSGFQDFDLKTVLVQAQQCERYCLTRVTGGGLYILLLHQGGTNHHLETESLGAAKVLLSILTWNSTVGSTLAQASIEISLQWKINQTCQYR